MGKSTISMAIFNSYVSLPEGTSKIGHSILDVFGLIQTWEAHVGASGPLGGARNSGRRGELSWGAVRVLAVVKWRPSSKLFMEVS